MSIDLGRMTRVAWNYALSVASFGLEGRQENQYAVSSSTFALAASCGGELRILLLGLFVAPGRRKRQRVPLTRSVHAKPRLLPNRSDVAQAYSSFFKTTPLCLCALPSPSLPPPSHPRRYPPPLSSPSLSLLIVMFHVKTKLVLVLFVGVEGTLPNAPSLPIFRCCEGVSSREHCHMSFFVCWWHVKPHLALWQHLF